VKPTYPNNAADAGFRSWHLWCQIWGCARNAVATLYTRRGRFDVCYKHCAGHVVDAIHEHGLKIRATYGYVDTPEGRIFRDDLITPIDFTPSTMVSTPVMCPWLRTIYPRWMRQLDLDNVHLQRRRR
jgi:hypothetical protein